MARSYNKFTDAAKEAGKSRIYAGIHWSFDFAAGEALGRKVGQYVADHYFQPLADWGGGTHQDVRLKGGWAGLGRGHEANGVTQNAWTAGARRTAGPVLAADADEVSVALTGFEWAAEGTGIGGRQSDRGSRGR